MYLSYFDLKQKPFSLTTDTSFVWFGKSQDKFIALMKESAWNNINIFILTGDPGVGKTMLAQSYIETCGEDIISAMVSCPAYNINTLSFLNLIHTSFKLKKIFHTKEAFKSSFKHFLNIAHKYNKKVLLVIDEAQCLTPVILFDILELTKFTKNQFKLFNILFVGQNTISEVLMDPKVKLEENEVTFHFNIEPLDLNETEMYIRHRLKVAGQKNNVFDSGAMSEIYSFSRGCPLEINNLCDLALMNAFIKREKKIESKTIKESIDKFLVDYQGLEKSN